MEDVSYCDTLVDCCWEGMKVDTRVVWCRSVSESSLPSSSSSHEYQPHPRREISPGLSSLEIMDGRVRQFQITGMVIQLPLDSQCKAISFNDLLIFPLCCSTAPKSLRNQWAYRINFGRCPERLSELWSPTFSSRTWSMKYIKVRTTFGQHINKKKST